MITDPTTGTVVAEDKEEAFWENARKRCETEIENDERGIIINNHILELCKKKLKDCKK